MPLNCSYDIGGKKSSTFQNREWSILIFQRRISAIDTVEISVIDTQLDAINNFVSRTILESLFCEKLPERGSRWFLTNCFKLVSNNRWTTEIENSRASQKRHSFALVVIELTSIGVRLGLFIYARGYDRPFTPRRQLQSTWHTFTNVSLFVVGHVMWMVLRDTDDQPHYITNANVSIGQHSFTRRVFFRPDIKRNHDERWLCNQSPLHWCMSFERCRFWRLVQIGCKMAWIRVSNVGCFPYVKWSHMVINTDQQFTNAQSPSLVNVCHDFWRQPVHTSRRHYITNKSRMNLSELHPDHQSTVNHKRTLNYSV